MEIIRKISFPRYASYNSVVRFFVEQGLGAKYIMPPALTRHTEELGERYSPEFVCTPFKTLLGSMIESLEAGADTLVMTHGACRLSYFGELQEQILRDLGYEFTFINLQEYNTGNKKDWLCALKQVNPKLNPARLTKAAMGGIRMLEGLDAVTAEYYQNCGFASDRTLYRQVYQKFLSDMDRVETIKEIESGIRKARQDLGNITLEKRNRPLRVGIVGELYTVMDSFSNRDVEQKIADMGVEVHRWMTFSNRMLHYNEKNLQVQISDLCDFDMGITSTANIWAAKHYAECGFDGLIHVKSANCTPEIDIVQVLQNISTDYKIPLLSLTYDSQTSDVGLMTRLEAFYDMIDEKKKVTV